MSTSSDKTSALFELAFRPFFLFGALFSAVAIALWALILNGIITPDLYGGSYWWHVHEMLFGFAPAIIVGFLLTAVQNWTGERTINGKLLMALTLLWISARVLLIAPNLLPASIIALIDIAFLPCSAVALGAPIVKVKLWRNLFFVPILLIMMYLNVTMHYAAANQEMSMLTNSSNTMVMMIILVMTIMGGRVFPMFTANGTQTAKVSPIKGLELATIASTLAVVVASFSFFSLHNATFAALLIFCAACHIIRVSRWKIWVTLRTPLVWSLHISYFAIPVGLIMLALSLITTWVTHSQAIHSITVGAMGLMILSMISRVSLGHTGRAIQIGLFMTFALVAIVFAFIIRVFGHLWLSNYNEVIATAAFFWVLGYAGFFFYYFPFLIKKRV